MSDGRSRLTVIENVCPTHDTLTREEYMRERGYPKTKTRRLKKFTSAAKSVGAR